VRFFTPKCIQRTVQDCGFGAMARRGRAGAAR
jgi:hypothetical protein